MSLAAAVTAQPVPEVHINRTIANHTVKAETRVFGFSREALYDVLKKCFVDFQPDQLDSIWKTDRNGTWYLTFRDRNQTELLISAGSLPFRDGKIVFTSYQRQVIKLRCHWVHETVGDNFLRGYFATFGKVLDIEHELVQMEDGNCLYSGVRIVSLEISEVAKSNIPHIVRFGESCSMLVVAPGRMPVCLRCKTLGHVRAECPRNNWNNANQRNQGPRSQPRQTPEEDPRPKSYADAVAGSQEPDISETDAEMVVDEEGPSQQDKPTEELPKETEPEEEKTEEREPLPWTPVAPRKSRSRGRTQSQETRTKKKKVSNIPAGVTAAALMASPSVETLRSPSVKRRATSAQKNVEVPVT